MVGRDRLVAAMMAILMNDQSGPVVVVDAGTAVTVDWVDSNNRFQGGNIFLGAQQSLKHLCESTDALPDYSERKYLNHLKINESVFGRSTESAIIRGTYYALLGAIKEIVKHHQRSAVSNISKPENEVPVYVTGGGIADIQFGIPATWNYVPDLVLQGTKNIGHDLLKNLSEANE